MARRVSYLHRQQQHTLGAGIIALEKPRDDFASRFIYKCDRSTQLGWTGFFNSQKGLPKRCVSLAVSYGRSVPIAVTEIDGLRCSRG